MCGACDYGPGDHGELSTDEWKAVIDSAVKLRVVLISMTGGEALLRKDLFELIRYAVDSGIAVHLNSNATFLNDKIVDNLSEAGVDTLSVSIDSPIREEHEKIRGEGTFDKTVAGIKNVKQRAPHIKIGLNSVVNTGNYKDLKQYIPLAKGLGVEQIKFMPIHTNLLQRDKAIDDYEEMIFTDKDVEDLDREIVELHGAMQASGLVTTCKAFYKGMTSLFSPPDSNFYCYAGYATCVIDNRGYVGPCFEYDGTYSVRERPLEDIWASPAYAKLREKVRSCDRNCWDTTNAEISLRFSIWNAVTDTGQLLHDLKYYLGKRKGAVLPESDGDGVVAEESAH
jgi:MoaA/NifB/PqqE/SkfB family radical SAM enzyme